MNKLLIKLFFSSILLVGVSGNSANAQRVQGERVTPLHVGDSKLRDTCFTNVFQSLSTIGFAMTGFFERIDGDIKIQSADFLVENSDVRFEVAYCAATDQVVGGKRVLGYVASFGSSMGEPWLDQYMEGPGNLCLIPKRTDVAQPKTIKNVFFYRDNVAVHVRNLWGGDVLAFTKLLDECILASSAEESKEGKNAIPKPSPAKTQALPTTTEPRSKETKPADPTAPKPPDTKK